MQESLVLHGKTFIPYISATEIEEKITLLAQQISLDYEGKKPLFIAVLNGAFIFAADLFRKISIEAEITFIKLASYEGTKSTGKVVTAIGLDAQLSNRHIIILEDIIDTGKTMHSFLPQLHQNHAASVKVAVLLHKPDATEYEVPVDYCCFTIPTRFVLGYGLDYDGYGRNTADLYQLDTSSAPNE